MRKYLFMLVLLAGCATPVHEWKDGLVKMSLAEMGFTKPIVEWSEIRHRMDELHLEYCPQGTASNLFQNGDGKPQSLFIAMEPIMVPGKRYPRVYIVRDTRIETSYIYDGWMNTTVWVFYKPH